MSVILYIICLLTLGFVAYAISEAIRSKKHTGEVKRDFYNFKEWEIIINDIDNIKYWMCVEHEKGKFSYVFSYGFYEIIVWVDTNDAIDKMSASMHTLGDNLRVGDCVLSGYNKEKSRMLAERLYKREFGSDYNHEQHKTNERDAIKFRLHFGLERYTHELC